MISPLRPLLVALLTCALWLASPVRTPAAESFGLGLSAGLVSGLGFSARYMPEQGVGWSAGAIYLRNGDWIFSHVAGELLYVLSRSVNSSLYLAGGGGYLFHHRVDQETVDPDPLIPGNEYEVDVVKEWKRTAFGAGIGAAARNMEWPYVWFSAELLLSVYRGNVLPYPQLGVHYFIH